MKKCGFILVLVFVAIGAALGQGPSSVLFGKNRVQFHQKFEEWSQYETDNFTIYWYGESRFIGQAAAVLAEYDFKEVQNLLEHRMNDRIEIIVYSDLTDLKQNNIGAEEAFENVEGQTKVVDNKIFIYFNGDYTHLRKQIRQGIAAVYLDAMLFGSNLQEIVQNAVLLHLPKWFKQGIINYVGEEWSTKLDNQLRNVLLSGRFDSFEKFAREEPQLAGHALWHYVGTKYGKSNVSNLLYLTRINRSIESGFIYVLGSSYEKVTSSCLNHFTERYENETKNTTTPTGTLLPFKNKRNIPINDVKISPNGQYLAFLTNEIGKIKVYLHHFSSKSTNVIFKKGFRNVFQETDYNYPQIAWSPNSLEMAILYEVRDKSILLRYDVNKKKSTEDDLTPNLQRVYSMDYVDPQTMVFSAANRGFSDIFLYFLNARMPQPITQDYYNDLDATVVRLGSSKGIIWASNRPDSLLKQVKFDSLPPINSYDLFYYDLQTRSKELVRITNTPFANERQPMGMDTTFFSFLTDENGVYNRKIAYLEEYIAFYEQVIAFKNGDELILPADSLLIDVDSTTIDSISIRPIVKKRAVSHFVTNYGQNILEQSFAGRVGKYAELVREGNKYNIYIDTLTASRSIPKLNFTAYRALTARQSEALAIQPIQQKIPSAVNKPKQQATAPQQKEKLKEDYIFETPFDEKEKEEKEEKDYFFQSAFDPKEETKNDSLPNTETPTQELKEDIPEKLLFEIEIPSFEAIAPISKETEQAGDERVHHFKPGRIIPYRIKFRNDFVTTEMDNRQLFDGLNSFSGVPEDFGYPPPGILFKANFKDLLEDYVIEGGVRIPTSFNGSEWFLTIDDRKKRLDKQYAFYRRVLRFDAPSSPALGSRRDENQIIIGQYSLRYPLDIYRSFRLQNTVRVDVTTPLSTDSVVINFPIRSEQRIGVRLEYIFDNTLQVALNIKNGTQYKIYGEVVKRFNLIDSELTFNNGFMNVIGLDFRHFQRLDRRSIFAFRLAGATTFGAERILYRLGGTDNWLFPEFNSNIPQPREGNFAYRTDVSNMRGFPLNIRNGNSYVLINNEFRVPVFKYFTKPERTFLQNIQLVGFFDLGTAWSGLNPFTEESPLNTSIYTSGPVNVKVNFFRDPVVAGYGFGARALIFSYFLRVDRGWGIETRVVQPPRWHIAIGTDF